MKKRWDEALRSLARRSQEPFRLLAYGVTRAPDGESALTADLRTLLDVESPAEDREIVAEAVDPFTGATQRPLFKNRVLPWITLTPPSASTPPAAVQDRRQLEDVAAQLAGFLDTLDEGVTARPPDAGGFRLLADPVVPSPRKRHQERVAIPVVLVRRFEDLGCDAEGIASAMEAIVLRGSHLRVQSEGLDTRTREGRAMASVALRLGGIKATLARERSLRDFHRRREGMQVYGPVPFGFVRQGQGLVPVPEQMEAVARLRELSRRGLSLLETALALNREGRAWKDATPWTWKRVRQILHNTIYDRPLRGVLA